MGYRLNKEDLLKNMAVWNGFLNKKVHLIACGGTAMTLLDVKESTRDVDFMVPVEGEYRYLIKILGQLGYISSSASGWRRPSEVYIYDLFRGNRIHTTELIDSPLNAGGHSLIKEFSRLYIGVLNHYDLIVSKLFRCTSVDVDDCLALMKARKKEIDMNMLREHFREMAQYDITEDRMMGNWEHFEEIILQEGLYGK